MLFSQVGARPEYGIVSGRVLAPDGTPAAGVRVAAVAVDGSVAGNATPSAMSSLTQTDVGGRYRLENVPPGRYYITAGLVDIPTYYPGVRSIGEALSIVVASGGTVTDIELKLDRSVGVRVSGRVTDIPHQAPQGFLGVALSRGPLIVKASLAADGTFEFEKVAPGRYRIGVTPPFAASSIDVTDTDVVGLELSVPPIIFGNVELENGGRLPVQAAAAAAGLADPPTHVSIQAFSARCSDCVPLLSPNVRGDGSFAVYPPDGGEAWIRATTLPLGYYVKSMLYGDVNLLERPLTLKEGNNGGLRVVLTTTPPAGTPPGVKVSGRVIGLHDSAAGSSFWITLVASSSSRQGTTYIRETLVTQDRTFELQGVLPGDYVLFSPPGTRGTVPIVVGGRDVLAIEMDATPAR
jgi:hypothetical protein